MLQDMITRNCQSFPGYLPYLNATMAQRSGYGGSTVSEELAETSLSNCMALHQALHLSTGHLLNAMRVFSFWKMYVRTANRLLFPLYHLISYTSTPSYNTLYHRSVAPPIY